MDCNRMRHGLQNRASLGNLFAKALVIKKAPRFRELFLWR
jgi:hypothetical protein